MSKRYSTWLALMILLLMTLGSPVHALVQESGNINCGGNYVAVRSYSTGTTKHYAPSSTQIGTYSNGGSWLVRVTSTFLSNTSWKVTTTGALDDAGTYAFCYGN